jgi:hypothetical protein
MRNIVSITVITVLLLLVPVLAQAHAPFIEPELLRGWGEVSEEPPRDLIMGAPAAWIGGEDWSFEYPMVLRPDERSYPYQDVTKGFAGFNYLHRNDVDVIKFTIEEGQTGFPIFGYGPPRLFITATAYPPACNQYSEFYPIAAIFGPGLPEIEEELPFELPEDCEDCGMVRTHPTRAVPGERMIFTTPTPRYSWFYYTDSETDSVWWEPDPTSPDGGLELGTYYIAFWEENGHPGEFSPVVGLDEYDDAFDRFQVILMAPLVDDMKTTRINCTNPAKGPSPPPWGGG